MASDSKRPNFSPTPFAGSTIVLVGSTGGGKTEFLNFLLGQRKFRCGMGREESTQAPTILTKETGGRSNAAFPAKDKEIADRLLLPAKANSKKKRGPKRKNPSRLKAPLPWLPEDVRIVDLIGFDCWDVKEEEGKKNEKWWGARELKQWTEEWIEEADMVVFIAPLESYKTGKALECLRFARSGTGAAKKHCMTLITKADMLVNDTAREVREEFKTLHQNALHPKPEFFFTFASRVRDESNLEWLKSSGHWEEIKKALECFRKQLEKLHILHARRRGAELGKNTGGDILDKDERMRMRKRAHAFEKFLNNQPNFKADQEREQELSGQDKQLGKLEKSKTRWISKLQESVKVVNLELIVTEETIEGRFKEIHDKASQKNHFFRNEIEKAFSLELDNLSGIIRQSVKKYVERLGKVLRKEMKREAKALCEEEREQLNKTFEEKVHFIGKHLDKCFSTTPPTSSDEDESFQPLAFLSEACLRLREGLHECHERVTALQTREFEPYETILNDGKRVVESFLENVSKLRDVAIEDDEKGKGIGHELRVSATKSRKSVAKQLKDTKKRLKAFRDAQESLNAARNSWAR